MMKQHMSVLVWCLLCTASLVHPVGLQAQCVITFDASRTGAPLSSVAFADSLSATVYAADARFGYSVLANAFFQGQGADGAWPSVAQTELGNAVRWRDAYLALATWGTTAVFSNVRITTPDGRLLMPDAVAAESIFWAPTGGAWQVADGALRQTDANAYGQPMVCYVPVGNDATISLTARKESGAEGFLVAFSFVDTDNYVWWNLGGWNNSQHAIERCAEGQKSILDAVPGSIQTGRDYDLRIELDGARVRCYLDGALVHDIGLQNEHRLYAAAAVSPQSDSLYVHLANPNAAAVPLVVRLDGGTLLKASAHRTATAVDFSHLESLRPLSASALSTALSGSGAVRLTLPATSLCLLRMAIADTGVADGLPQIAVADEPFDTAAGERPSAQGIFDLAGRRIAEGGVGGRPLLPKGIYVVNGRKKWLK